MARNGERNDARPARKTPGKKPAWRPGRPAKPASPTTHDRLWGWHPVMAALANPARGEPIRLLATPERAKALPPSPALRIAEARKIAEQLPAGAVHQGVMLEIAAPQSADLEDFEAAPGRILLMLDQVTDPQNVGAILRSAAAFGAAGVVLQERHAPRLDGALAKASAGAVDALPIAHVVNLSRALERLAELGWRAVGLTGGAVDGLAEVLDGSPTVLVLGSEGEGLRRLVAEHCDTLARIPMPGGFESLNVSAAAAVALYEAARPR